MKTFVASILAAGLLMSGGAQAQSRGDVVVEGTPLTLTRWTAVVAEQLNGGLEYPRPLGNEALGSGIVSVTFRCSESGRPDGVKLSRTSGFYSLDRAAIRAVRQMKTMHPMPEGLKPDQLYVANILFAQSARDHDRQIALMQKDAVRRNAWFREGEAIAINVGSQTRRRARS